MSPLESVTVVALVVAVLLFVPSFVPHVAGRARRMVGRRLDGRRLARQRSSDPVRPRRGRQAAAQAPHLVDGVERGWLDATDEHFFGGAPREAARPAPAHVDRRRAA